MYKIIFFILFIVSFCSAQVLSNLDNQLLHLKSGTGVTVTGSGVSNWADQSGNSDDFDQDTDADRPADGGTYLDFDKSNSEFLEHDDDTDFEFGNNSEDSPFSVMMRIVIDDATDSRPFFAKFAVGDYEYFYGCIGEDLYVRLLSQDQSTVYIQRVITGYNAFEGDTITIGFTYDATEDTSGIIMYHDGIAQTSTGTENGSYVAMKGTPATVTIGTYYDESVLADFKMLDLMVTGDVLTPTEVGFLYMYFETGSWPDTTNYYIDADKGNDAFADSLSFGHSIAYALASFDSINTAGITLEAGDSVFFRTNDTFDDTLTVPASGSSGN